MIPDIKFPEALKDLPVARSIQNGEIDLEGSFCLIAHTGSGKTICIPVAKAAMGFKVILRQPTRQTCKLTYLGLKKFWDDQFKIGMHTSEESYGSLDECDIMVCTDGVMKNWLRFPKHRLCVIFDEYHWQQAITEIESAIVKTYLNSGTKFDLVLLSATIRPSNILKYLENLNGSPVSEGYINKICDTLDMGGSNVNSMEQQQWLKCYYAEGVAHPITNLIEPYMEPTTAEKGSVMRFAEEMLEEAKRGLVFLCTRREVQEACDHIREKLPDLPVEFTHADVSIEKTIKFVEENEPSLLFATVSLATSATLPFDEVLIIDKGIDTVYEGGLQKQVTDIPIENNGVLQRRGRVGRVKPGVCTLATNFRESWNDIRPTHITPPLEKVSPIEASLVCAQYEMDPRKLDTLSKLNMDDIDRSVRRLKGMRVVYEDEEENTLKLTSLGKRVSALPLEVDLSVMVAQCPEEILPAIIAIASCDAGLYGLFQPKIRTTIKNPDGEEKTETVPGISLLNPDLIHRDSTLVTKSKILQAAYRAQSDENTTMPEWAEANGMWPKKIEKILSKYYQITNKGLGKSMRNMKEHFLEMDIDHLAPVIINYLKDLRLFDEAYLHYDEYDGKPGYKGDHFGYFTILDGSDFQILDLKSRMLDEIHIMGTPKIIKPKRSNRDICIFGDSTLLPMGE